MLDACGYSWPGAATLATASVPRRSQLREVEAAGGHVPVQRFDVAALLGQVLEGGVVADHVHADVTEGVVLGGGRFLHQKEAFAVPEDGVAAPQPMTMSFQERAVSGACTLSYRQPVAHCSWVSLDEYGWVAAQSRYTFSVDVGWPSMNEWRPLSDWQRCTSVCSPRRQT